MPGETLPTHWCLIIRSAIDRSRCWRNTKLAHWSAILNFRNSLPILVSTENAGGKSANISGNENWIRKTVVLDCGEWFWCFLSPPWRISLWTATFDQAIGSCYKCYWQVSCSEFVRRCHFCTSCTIRHMQPIRKIIGCGDLLVDLLWIGSLALVYRRGSISMSSDITSTRM